MPGKSQVGILSTILVTNSETGSVSKDLSPNLKLKRIIPTEQSDYEELNKNKPRRPSIADLENEAI
jgi:hypothetical protein